LAKKGQNETRKWQTMANMFDNLKHLKVFACPWHAKSIPIHSDNAAEAPLKVATKPEVPFAPKLYQARRFRHS
jgi:hypothetical protein